MSEKSSLNCEEILTALTISAATNPSAEAALGQAHLSERLQGPLYGHSLRQRRKEP